MTHPLFNLTDAQKAAIRALELAALLHDMGKLTDEFVQSQANNSTSSFRYEVVADPQTIFDQNLMGTISALGNNALRRLFFPGDAKPASVDVHDHTADLMAGTATYWDAPYNLAEILLLGLPFIYHNYTPTYQGVFTPSLIQPARLLGFLHGLAHFEKDDPGAGTQIGQRQSAGPTFRSSAFGHESELPDLTRAYRKLPLGGLQNTIDAATSFRQREDELQQFLTVGLGDTRWPINEVSLWDWSYSVSAFAKAAAAQIFTQGWPQNEDLGSFLRVQTVRVSFDRLEALTNSDRISDLLGVKETLDESYKQVRDLFESELSLGKQIYADETGAFFLCPAFDIEETELRERVTGLFSPDMQPLVYAGEEIVTGEINRFRFKDPEENKETYAEEEADHYAKRRLLITHLLAEPRRAALDEAPIQPDHPFPDAWQTAWEGDDLNTRRAELCTVCRMRPVGYPFTGNEAEGVVLNPWATSSKARQRHICRVCLNRRGRQAEDWLQGDYRLKRTIWTDEVADDSGRLALLVGRLPLDNWLDGALLDTLLLEPGQGVAKNPSPARLYRIAEEARTFWKDQIEDTIPHEIGHGPFRLQVTPENAAPGLGLGHAYELDFGEFSLQVVWNEDHFLSAENLAGMLRRRRRQGTVNDNGLSGNAPLTGNHLEQFLINAVAGKTTVVRAPSGFLEPGNTEVEGVTIGQATAVDQEYTPQITLVEEPGLAMVLIPAVKAMAVAQAIQQTYLDRFGRVMDRLPLHLGLVYFRRRTPLAAVLDAGRRFLNLPGAWEPWTATVDSRLVTFKDSSGRQFEHQYPALMGDGETEDKWYPYFLTHPPALDSGPQTVTYIDDLSTDSEQPSEVYIRPSYFDYEYLDTAGRRYEIAYEEDGRRGRRLGRPYLLAELDDLQAAWEAFAVGLEESQRHQVIGYIENARYAWFGVGGFEEMRRLSQESAMFREFVKQTLCAASWKAVRICNWDTLIDIAVSGQLTDLAELHMEIMGKATDEILEGGD